MAFTGNDKIWMNGKLVDWKDATIHVATHAIHYGTGVFEGIRAYDSKHGTHVFRLARAHAPPVRLVPRLSHGAAVVARRAVERGARDHPRQRLQALLHPAARLSRLRLSSASTRCPARSTRRSSSGSGSAYLGAEALEKGVDVGVSSWTRMAPNTLPAMAKAHRQLRELRR